MIFPMVRYANKRAPVQKVFQTKKSAVPASASIAGSSAFWLTRHSCLYIRMLFMSAAMLAVYAVRRFHESDAGFAGIKLLSSHGLEADGMIALANGLTTAEISTTSSNANYRGINVTIHIHWRNY